MPSGDFNKEQTPAMVPIWHEALTGVDWVSLHCSPIYFGLGVPHGNGSAVITVPGFLTSDNYLWELNNWLKRVGYESYKSEIGRNADCFDLLVNKLLVTIEKAYKQSGRRVFLVGHSLGGVIARAAAELKSEQVAAVITMGSPFRGIRSHPVILGANMVLQQQIKFTGKRPDQPHCMTGYCTCKGTAALGKSLSGSEVRHTAIYSKNDGIVDWQMCLNEDPASNFEVASTHCGMVFHPTVYRILAERLAREVKIEARSRGKNSLVG